MLACLLGVWQMWARSPLKAPGHTAANYFGSVTLHGVSMAYTGLQGQWRRVAAFDYSDPLVASWGPYVLVSLAGGVLLAASAILFVANLVGLHRAPLNETARPPAYALAVHPPVRVPPMLNGFGLWNWLVALLMLGAYGFPIAQFFLDPPPQAVVHHVN